MSMSSDSSPTPTPIFNAAHRAFLDVTKGWDAASWTRQPEYVTAMFRAVAPHLTACATGTQDADWTEADRSALDHLADCESPAWMGELASRARAYIATLESRLGGPASAERAPEFASDDEARRAVLADWHSGPARDEEAARNRAAVSVSPVPEEQPPKSKDA